MGVGMGIKGLAAMLLGGLGTFPGAMIGGLRSRIVEVVGVAYLSSSYGGAFAFVVIIAVLFRPRGVSASDHVAGWRLDPSVEYDPDLYQDDVVLALSLYLPVSAGLLSLGRAASWRSVPVSGSVRRWWNRTHDYALVCGGVVRRRSVVSIPFAAGSKGSIFVIMTMGSVEIVRVFFLNFEPTGAASE